MSSLLDKATEALARATSLLVVTGAGVSAESGIPTFRGDGGLWEGYRAEELATPQAFAADPHRVWRWYRMRREVCLRAAPNPAHDTIAAMEEAYEDYLLATQNVDGLHPRAGSHRLVEMHGSIHHGRCTGCEVVERLPDPPEPQDAPVPRCDDCGEAIRPHIVWFGESYQPGVLEESFAAAGAAEVAILAGTSAQVWPPIAVALHARKTGAFLIEVNPEETSVSAETDASLRGPAGEVLPSLFSRVLELRA